MQDLDTSLVNAPTQGTPDNATTVENKDTRPVTAPSPAVRDKNVVVEVVTVVAMIVVVVMTAAVSAAHVPEAAPSHAQGQGLVPINCCNC